MLGLGNEAREREREKEREREREREGGSKRMGFHSPLEPMDEMWASVCGCQSSKISGKSRPRAHLSFSARSKAGDHRRWACERSPPSCGGSSLLAPESKTSAEKIEFQDQK